MDGIKSNLCTYVLNVHTLEFVLGCFVLCFLWVWESSQNCTRFVSFSCFAQRWIQGLLWKEKFPWLPYAIESCLSRSTYYFTDSCSWHAEEEQSEMPVGKPLEVLKIKMRHWTTINHSRSSMCLSIALSEGQCFQYLVIFPIWSDVWGKSDIL